MAAKDNPGARAGAAGADQGIASGRSRSDTKNAELVQALDRTTAEILRAREPRELLAQLAGARRELLAVSQDDATLAMVRLLTAITIATKRASLFLSVNVSQALDERDAHLDRG